MAATSMLSLDRLENTLGADIQSTTIAAICLGVLFHLCIQKVEIDYMIWHLLGLSTVVLSALVYAHLSLRDCTLPEATAKALLVAVSFNTGLAISIAVYRLFFHRLRQFPGPLGAKLSRFYTVKIAAKNCQYNLEVAKMHEQYGDFVRTGPRELCIVRRSAVPIIYGPQSKCLKSTWYSQVSKDSNKSSVHMTRDFEDHKRRRKAWDRGFSMKALATYEPRIKSCTDLFMSQLKARAGTSVNITEWSMLFSFDVMGEVGFSKDFGNLASGREHSAIKGIHDHMAIMGLLSNVPWLLNMLGSLPGLAGGYTGFFNWCSNEIKEKQRTWNPDQTPQDIVSWLLKAFKERDQSAPPSEAALDEDGRVIIIAGSDSIANTTTNALYFLTKHPATFRELQSLVDQAIPGGEREWSYEKVKAIPFLDDIINETLRLKPALLTGTYRVTPPSGCQIDEVYVLGDTNVFVPTQVIQQDPRYYAKPLEFIPERWSDNQGQLSTENAPFIPFSLGVYNCPGKHLALQTLRSVLSRIAQQYDVSLASRETGETFDSKTQDTFTMTLPPLHLHFTPRQAKQGLEYGY
ncbi:MAG: hypothetical protein M1830_001736 [Pleopsidium flavum]|nr:MAG: hypothetical protein M1830_001736 [Pleopsidium flavum]